MDGPLQKRQDLGTQSIARDTARFELECDQHALGKLTRRRIGVSSEPLSEPYDVQEGGGHGRTSAAGRWRCEKEGKNPDPRNPDRRELATDPAVRWAPPVCEGLRRGDHSQKLGDGSLVT